MDVNSNLTLCLPFHTRLINFAPITPFGPKSGLWSATPMRAFAKRSLPFLRLLVCLLLTTASWPQAQPKPTPTPQATVPATTSGSCTADYYRNSDGVCVKRPVKNQDAVPQGATAQCRDGSYSFSQHRSGTCSHHGGVAKWLSQ